MSAVTDLIGNATGGGYSAPSQYNTWQPSGTASQDTNFNNAINSNINAGSQATPAWQQYLNSVTNNPYQGQAQNASNLAGQAYGAVGGQALQNANNINGAASGILQSSMDPQSALYNRLSQQNTDATNASLAARGLNSSAQGADIASQSNNNFNIDWLNNLQGLQTKGLSAGASGLAEAGQQGAAGAASLNAAGQTPLSTYNAGVANTGSGLQGYNTGINSTNQTALADIMSYLGLGAQQSNQQGNFNNQYWQNQNAYTSNANNQNNQLWGDIGNGLFGTAGTPAGMFGGGSSSTSGLLGSGGNLGSLASIADLFA